VGWRATYNMARLTAAGYTVKESVQYMSDHGLWFSSLLAENKGRGKWGTISQRGVNVFSLYDLYNPEAYGWSLKQSILTDPIGELLSPEDNFGRKKTLGKRLAGTASAVNSTVGGAAKAVQEGSIDPLLKGLNPMRSREISLRKERAKREKREKRQKREKRT